MRLGAPAPPPSAEDSPPSWPPLLATRGLGSASTTHSHHGMHLVLALDGALTVETPDGSHRAAGVLTAPDVPHALDADGLEILLVFLDPESSAGASLRPRDGVCTVDGMARDRLVRDAEPMAIMSEPGVKWTRDVLVSLGLDPAPPRKLHPKVRQLLELLPSLTPEDDTSLERLAAEVKLSPGRLMHAFTDSVGIPLRPYLAWLKVQRAAAAIVSGVSMTQAAHAAGFSDAGHMTRSFRRMLGMTPSSLRP
ncbi:MAG: helix-turn-helix transcriptional regulator [Nannocystaceae bacterium]|nr:helix-turn-helix transcriptional regulator [Nannocystaceae bacterium]